MKASYVGATAGAGYNSGNPDTWGDVVTDGHFHIDVSVGGVDETNGLGPCQPTPDSTSQSFPTPGMSVATSPPAPMNQDGPGGVVGQPVESWIEGGYDGGLQSTQSVQVHPTDCVDANTIPPSSKAQTRTYSAHIDYQATNPKWYFTDTNDGGVDGVACSDCPVNPGWVPHFHLFNVSSAGQPDFPDRGPSWVIFFTFRWQYQGVSDVPGFQPQTKFDQDGRGRVYPVRQVQSVLVSP